jgi:hypothetical protein
MAEIKQDSEALMRIAEDIRDLATGFAQVRDTFFEVVHNQIGEDETHTTWYGPNANKFITEFDKTAEEFNKAYGNIISMANNLESQANAWNAFEGNRQE